MQQTGPTAIKFTNTVIGEFRMRKGLGYLFVQSSDNVLTQRIYFGFSIENITTDFKNMLISNVQDDIIIYFKCSSTTSMTINVIPIPENVKIEQFIEYPKSTSTGQLLVTEASAAGIAGYVSYLPPALEASKGPFIATPYANALNLNWQRRIVRAVINCDGAGSFANIPILTALAGYYGVVEIKGIITDATAVAGIITFESPAGTPALPSIMALPSLTANLISKWAEDVHVTHLTLIDNQAIVLDGQGFGVGATVIFECLGWYET